MINTKSSALALKKKKRVIEYVHGECLDVKDNTASWFQILDGRAYHSAVSEYVIDRCSPSAGGADWMMLSFIDCLFLLFYTRSTCLETFFCGTKKKKVTTVGIHPRPCLMGEKVYDAVYFKLSTVYFLFVCFFNCQNF